MTQTDTFKDLTGLTGKKWDEVIKAELAAAGLRTKKFRKYDSPNSWVQHTLEADFGEWTLARDARAWSLWCKVPLGSAEVIASSPLCQAGSIPKQWHSVKGKIPATEKVHRLLELPKYVTWVIGDEMLVKDIGQSADHKDAIIHDGGHALARKIRFVADPEAVGEPYIMNYTFFTPAALDRFLLVVKRHNLLPATTFV